MRDEFEERERSVGDSLTGDEKPSESHNGQPRWDPTPRVGTAPADAYSSSSEPYISTLSPMPESVQPQEALPVEEPSRPEEPLSTEATAFAEQPAVMEAARAESIDSPVATEVSPAP